MQCTSQSKRLYRVLTPEDREEIMTGRRRGESIRSIARRLDRNPSVISREIKNNSAEDNQYQAYWANSRSHIRRRQSRKRERISDPVIREYVIEKLEPGWSPRQIAGRIEIDLPGKSISHETIYMYIFKKRRDLTQYLVCGRKNRRKRHQYPIGPVSKIVLTKSIFGRRQDTGRPIQPSADRAKRLSWFFRSEFWELHFWQSCLGVLLRK